LWVLVLVDGFISLLNSNVGVVQVFLSLSQLI
jgi:hypothetical protein